jgi:RND family efflux transporter MFP subunit
LDPRDALGALKIDREQHEPQGSPRSRWPLMLLALLTLAGAGGAAAWWLNRPPMITVHTVMAQSVGGGAGTSLSASGYVVAQQEAAVAAQVTGMVTAVYVHEGDKVTAGQILARLDDSAARDARGQAQSQLDTDRALVPQFEAQLARDRRMRARDEKLVQAQAISRSTLDDARAAVAVSRARLAHARGQVGVDRKKLELQKTLLSYMVIRAPFSGVVTERYAHPGEMISPQAVGGFTQTGICKIVDMHSLEIDVDVNEVYIQRVHANQKVEAVLDAYPNWTIPAHVISVVPTANEQKAAVKVRIAFDHLDPRILPQMGVAVRFISEEAGAAAMRARGVTIPAAALHGRVGRQYVYTVESGHVRQQAVAVRPAGAKTVRVLTGLMGGERVVVSASAPLKNGEEVSEP